MNDSIVALSLYKERLNLQGASFSRIEHDEAIIATVYKISTPDDKEYILKICSRDEHYFGEVYFLKYFSDILPLPHIIKTIEPTPGVNGAILMEYLPGHLLKKEDLIDSLAKRIGLLLAKIHDNKADGYGDVTQPDKLKNNPFEYFNFKFEEGLNECKDNLADELLDQCRILYNNNIKYLDLVDGPCFTHRDFRPSNIIVNNNTVQGIIDWSSARASFAEEDFYPLEFGKWTDDGKLKKSFLEGYASIRPIPAYENIMPLLVLSAAIATIGFTFRSGTWKTKNANLYQRKLESLEKLIAEHLSKKA